jgi:hypothetical protein
LDLSLTMNGHDGHDANSPVTTGLLPSDTTEQS